MTWLITLYVLTAVGIGLIVWAVFKLKQDEFSGWGFVLGSIGVVVLIFAGIFAGGKTWERSACSYAEQQYQLPTRWNFWYGCYIKADNRYIPIDQYRAIIKGGK